VKITTLLFLIKDQQGTINFRFAVDLNMTELVVLIYRTPWVNCGLLRSRTTLFASFSGKRRSIDDDDFLVLLIFERQYPFLVRSSFEDSS
jgi:hypothetical protein